MSDVDEAARTMTGRVRSRAEVIETGYHDGGLLTSSISVTWIDCACSPKLSLGRLVEVIRVVIPDVIIGPPCTSAMIPVADLGSFFNVPVFSWISNEHTLDNKTRASTLVRTLPPLSSLGNLLLSVCRNLDWHTISIISTLGGMTEGIADYFKEILDNSEFFLARHFDRVNTSLTVESIRRMYAFIKGEARIVFLIVPMEELRTYMLAAHDMDMTSGDFQFLFTRQMIAEDGFVKLLQGKGLWERGDGRDSDAYQAYKNLLYFTFSFMLEYYDNTVDAYNASVRVFGQHPNMPTFEMPDRYARFLHDTFYLYCLAANITRQRNQTVDGANIFKTSTEIGFNGMTGYVHLDNEADRLPSYLVWDMDLDGSFRVIMQIAHNFYNNSITNITYPDGVLEIHWGNGMSYSEGYIPLDSPVCGFRNEKCPENSTAKTVIPAVLVSVMLAVVIVFFILFRWWKKEQKLYSKTWRVLWKDLKFETRDQMITGHNGSHSTVNSDDHGGCSSVNSSFRLNVPSHQAYYCKTAMYGNERVVVRMIRKKNIRFDRKLLEELHLLTHSKNPNLTQFFGVCTDPPNLCILWEYCNKGSVQDVIHNSYNNYELDSLFQFSIALDICTGLNYIHGSELKVHGNLTSANCLLDNRWTCKLSGFGVRRCSGERSHPRA
ncbi:atrial natriuretic peptide receptor 1-like isoform X2 [Pomacea canaliculata]|uniref:atrial natriuretic peptide receptor 1-like isoform X2 n=1 Tax=Pomacea canaliculata TaxID=400727 RepID=UPI000D734C5A|nr:atrial natriuretic peptide receptor 1-like isoform X2 [Pomacea canaliculata]